MSWEDQQRLFIIHSLSKYLVGIITTLEIMMGLQCLLRYNKGILISVLPSL